MTVSRFKAILPGDVQTVWDIVTGVMEYPAWRSDVERVETLGAQTFWEYAKGGYVTKFTITGEEHCRRWTLAMDDRPLGGRVPAAGRGHRRGFYRICHGQEVLDAASGQTVSETPAGAVCGRPADGAESAARQIITQQKPPG